MTRDEERALFQEEVARADRARRLCPVEYAEYARAINALHDANGRPAIHRAGQRLDAAEKALDAALAAKGAA